MAKSSRRICLAFGEDVAKVECGLLYAMNLLSHKKKLPVKAIRSGLETAKTFAGKAVNRIRTSETRKLADEIIAETGKIDKRLEKKASNGAVVKKLEAVRKMALKLREQGAKACKE